MTNQYLNPDIESLFKDKVLKHPAGLFILFFTEMWERFSFYGMRILLVLFLTAPLIGENPGWGWTNENALALIGTYASLLYLTPILGGWIADKFTGYRLAVVIGCILMTLGHASMAMETPATFYIGLGLLIAGTGFFKPNITSIISQMYENHQDKKDGAYTIFYMGVNSGAFFGMMLCGFLAENYGWSYGFGLAGIFMFLGMMQFLLAGKLFGSVGARPTGVVAVEIPETDYDESPDVPTVEMQSNPFTPWDNFLLGLSAFGGFLYLINDPLEKIKGISLFPFHIGALSGSSFVIISCVLLFLGVIISRISRYTPIVRDRMIAVGIFSLFTIFFFAFFEQSLGSMTITARDYTNRILDGSSSFFFKLIDLLLTVGPLIIITWVFFMLARKTFSKITLSNIFLALAIIGLWGLVIFRLEEKLSGDITEVDASWFGILNSFFIISLAPMFSNWWESKYNPSAAYKYALGLILLGVGFAFLAFGTRHIPKGAESASVSMVFLICAYLFHTMGELCLSPVGLSYISKLVPPRMIGFMFGVYYLAIAIGQKAAGTMGGMIDQISEKYSIGAFFLLFTIIPIIVGLFAVALNPLIKRLMHGIR